MPVRLKVARIGRSRGVRLPATALRRYRIGDSVLMEERADGILLRSADTAVEKLSWEQTAREMAAAREDWTDWEAIGRDGITGVPWNPGDRVAERTATKRSPGRSRQPGRR